MKTKKENKLLFIFVEIISAQGNFIQFIQKALLVANIVTLNFFPF